MQNDIDEFANVGGSYLLDPKTGKRTRVEYTAEPGSTPEAVAAPEVPAVTAGKTTTPDKE